MSTIRIHLLALLAVGTMLHGTDAVAQAHLPLQPEYQPVAPVEPDVWLRRLVGNFSLDGAYVLGDCATNDVMPGPPPCTGIKGNMNCIAVGDGPGVQCIINALWILYIGNPPIDLSSFLDPSMMLLGLDPGRAEINLLLVNDRGLTNGGFGVVEGGIAEFKNRCPGANEDGCRIGIRIEAKADANLNYMWIGNNLQISMRRVAPGKAGDLNDRLNEVTSEESEEEISRVKEDAREERAVLALEPPVKAPVAQVSGKPQPVMDALDEVVAESETERRRQAQAPRRIQDPDVVTVTRHSTKAGNSSVRVRVQPYTPQRQIRFRASDARQLAEGANPHLQLQRDRLTTDNESLIRSVTLEFTAGADEANGLPALIPINATTSLFNFDYLRLDNSPQPLMAKLRNVMDPETRRCNNEYGLGNGNGDGDFQNRFVLLGDRYADCNRTVNSREGDLVFADSVPQRLRQELRDLYDPVYNQFSRNLGSEPGIVFVVWRPESPRNDFRLVRSLNRTSLLVFNGPSWQQGFTAQQRDELWENVAQEQIARRIQGSDAITEAAADYLLKLAKAERQQATNRWLSNDLPDWIAACARTMNLRVSTTSALRRNVSYDCSLVVQFVYDAVARAKSKGESTVTSTWRTLLADAYRRKQSTVSSNAFLDSSADAHRIVQGLFSGAMDWTAFVVDLGKVGVQLRVTPGQVAPSVQVQSLSDFRN
jgi:hypothetical protein